MNKYINFFTVLTFILIGIGCKNDTNTSTVSPASQVVELPVEFFEFYQKFHVDSTFQVDHIVFPLSQKRDGSKWEKDNWVLHKPFDDLGGEFSRDFTNLNGLIIEIMKDKTGTVTIERRYSVMNDEYHLIYYTIESTFGS